MEEDNSSEFIYELVKNSGQEDFINFYEINVGVEGAKQIAKALMHSDTKVRKLCLRRNHDLVMRVSRLL